MSTPTPMSRDDLLELAALDAFSLLDEYEAALFTRSFHHAPVAVQDEIKRLQAEYAGDESLLPDVAPAPSLKSRTLASVASAIEEESMELAPLATIGRARSPRDTIARIGSGSNGHYWRAASFVLAAVAVLFAYFGAQARQRNEQLWDFVIHGESAERVDDLLGRDLVTIATDPRSVRVNLHAPALTADAPAGFVIALEVANESGDRRISGIVTTDFLPSGGRYTLIARNAAGKEVFGKSFVTRAALAAVPLDLDATIASNLAALTWEMFDDRGTLVLTSVV